LAVVVHVIYLGLLPLVPIGVAFANAFGDEPHGGALVCLVLMLVSLCQLGLVLHSRGQLSRGHIIRSFVLPTVCGAFGFGLLLGLPSWMICFIPLLCHLAFILISKRGL
jgi:hypothetical protein